MQSWDERELGALMGGQRLAAEPGTGPAPSHASGSPGPDDTEHTEQLQEQCSRLSLQACPFRFSESLVTLFSMIPITASFS